MNGNNDNNSNQQTNTPSSMHSQQRTPQMQGITPPMKPLPRPQNVRNLQYSPGLQIYSQSEQEPYTPITPQSPNETDALFGGSNNSYQRLSSNRSQPPSTANGTSKTGHTKQVSFNLPNDDEKNLSPEDPNISSVATILTR